jgi:glycosyltransferase involved in cell wall biosynthesis
LLINNKKVVIAEPVGCDQLINVASECDVGIIPYLRTSINHTYCCPNKLSQYMNAGLAILANNLDFIKTVINQYQCGIIYDQKDTTTLRNAIHFFIENPEKLKSMKENAYNASKTKYNWETQSRDYIEALTTF